MKSLFATAVTNYTENERQLTRERLNRIANEIVWVLKSLSFFPYEYRLRFAILIVRIKYYSPLFDTQDYYLYYSS